MTSHTMTSLPTSHRKPSLGVWKSRQPSRLIWVIDIFPFDLCIELLYSVVLSSKCSVLVFIISGCNMKLAGPRCTPAMPKVINDLFTYSCPEQCKELRWLVRQTGTLQLSYAMKSQRIAPLPLPVSLWHEDAYNISFLDMSNLVGASSKVQPITAEYF